MPKLPVVSGAEVVRTLKRLGFAVAPQRGINQLCEIERPTANHLYWPELALELSVDSIRNPENFPLISKIRAGCSWLSSFNKMKNLTCGQVHLAPQALRLSVRSRWARSPWPEH